MTLLVNIGLVNFNRAALAADSDPFAENAPPLPKPDDGDLAHFASVLMGSNNVGTVEFYEWSADKLTVKAEFATVGAGGVNVNLYRRERASDAWGEPRRFNY